MLQGFTDYGSVPVKFPKDICMFKIQKTYAAVLLSEQDADEKNTTRLIIFVEKVESCYYFISRKLLSAFISKQSLLIKILSEWNI